MDNSILLLINTHHVYATLWNPSHLKEPRIVMEFKNSGCWDAHQHFSGKGIVVEFWFKAKGVVGCQQWVHNLSSLLWPTSISISSQLPRPPVMIVPYPPMDKNWMKISIRVSSSLSVIELLEFVRWPESLALSLLAKVVSTLWFTLIPPISCHTSISYYILKVTGRPFSYWAWFSFPNFIFL